MPDPAASHSKSPITRSKIPRYYHVGYRTYDNGTNVRTFSLREVRKLTDKIAAVNRKLFSPETYTDGTVYPDRHPDVERRHVAALARRKQSDPVVDHNALGI